MEPLFTDLYMYFFDLYVGRYLSYVADTFFPLLGQLYHF